MAAIEHASPSYLRDYQSRPSLQNLARHQSSLRRVFMGMSLCQDKHKNRSKEIDADGYRKDMGQQLCSAHNPQKKHLHHACSKGY